MAAMGSGCGTTSNVFKLLTAAARPRELTGAVDLIGHYGLREHYEAYTKKSFPVSIADSRYLRDVVGDIEIRKGDGMELGQLLQGAAPASDGMMTTDIKPFELESLRRAFTFRESGPISLPEADRGLPTIGKSKDRKEKKKHRKEKHKHRHKDKDKEKDKDREKRKEKDKDRDHANGEDKSKKHKKKKRKHEGEEEDADGHKHKKKKDKYKTSPNPDALAVKIRA